MNEFEEFEKLVKEVPFEELDIVDQLKIVAAYASMMKTVKPILLKHLAAKESGTTGSTFLFKMS